MITEGIAVRELFTADVEGVESVGAVGAVLQQVFFGLSEFLAALVLAEAVAPAHDSRRLDGQDEVIVVLAVEHRHEPLFAGKTLVDEQVLLIMAHGVSQVDVLDLPAVPLELVAHHPVEVLFVHGIVAAQGGTVVIIDDYLGLVVGIVAAEVVNERGDLALELRVEALDDVQAAPCGLARHDPVDVGVIVHADADGRIGVHVLVCPAVQLRLAEIIAQAVEIVEVAGVILVRLSHRRIESVFGNADALTKDGCLERLVREVALHLLDIRFTQQLQVLDAAVLLVVHGHGAHLVEIPVQVPQVVAQVFRQGHAFGIKLPDALLGTPDLINGALDRLDKILVHLVLIMQEPGALLGLRHIAEDHHRVVERVVAEVGLDAAVGRQRLVLESLVIDELGLIDQEPRKGQRIAAAGAVLGYDNSAGTIVERDDVLIFCGLYDRLSEGLGRFPTDNVVNAFHEAPALPCGQQARYGIRQTVLVGRHHDATCAAGHALHVTQHEGRGDRIGLAGSSPRHDNGGIGPNELGQSLWVVKVYFLLHRLCRQIGWWVGIVWTPPGRPLQTRHPRYRCSRPGTCGAVPECALVAWASV